MEDGTDAAQDGRGDDGAVAEEQQLHGEDELHDCNSMEVDNVVEHGNSGKSFESASGEHEHLPVNENPEVPGSGEVPMDEDEFPPPKDDGAVESCSDSGAFVRTLPEGKAEDEKCKEELSGGVPAVLSFAERVELENDSSPGGDVRDEESAEAIMEEIFVSKNDGEELNRDLEDKEKQLGHEMELQKQQLNGTHENDTKPYSRSFLLNADDVAGDESGTEEEQAAFMKELETFHRERCLEFKPPKFYQEPLNCLKLWRAVVRLGGYEQVTSLKQWRQVGESFKPPKTCTTVSWTFRGFYEKALLEYEKYKMHRGELPFTDASSSGPASGHQVDHNHASGSGRARRDAAARAMQGWHSQRLLGNGEVGDPIVKDKNPVSTPKREKQLRNIGFLKRNGSSHVEQKVARASKLQLRSLVLKPLQIMKKFEVTEEKAMFLWLMEIMVMDVGIPADWVKVNVQRTKDCYEVYALVPGLLREEVRVQSDPAGRLVISGQPEERDNPWGVTPFKKIVSLPTRIDPHQTSAVVTLHGQLFVRVPFAQLDV